MLSRTTQVLHFTSYPATLRVWHHHDIFHRLIMMQYSRTWPKLMWFSFFPQHSFPCSRNVSCRPYYFSKSWIIQCGFIWNETMQLVSGRVEFNACQVSLMWHNFLVSLWTFQPILEQQITWPMPTLFIYWSCLWWIIKHLVLTRALTIYDRKRKMLWRIYKH